MKHHHRVFIASSLLATALSGHLSQASELSMTVGSVEGRPLVGGKPARPGQILKTGDRLKAGPKDMATVLLPDGSVLIIGSKTEIESRESPNSLASADVKTGTLRGLISKTNRVKNKDYQKRVRLLLKFKSVVLGVRGTDFVLSTESAAESAASNVFTLEGTVEVARTEEKIISREAIPVEAGKSVEATPEKIEPPKPFKREELVEKLQTADSGFTPPPVKEPESPPQNIPETKPEATRPDTNWKFQFGIQGGGLPNGDEPGGFAFSWNPSIYRITSWLSLDGGLGVFLYSSDQIKSRSFYRGVDARLMLSTLIFNRIIFEIGPYYKYWIQHGLSSGASALLGWNFPDPLFGLINRVFVGASGFSVPESLRWDYNRNWPYPYNDGNWPDDRTDNLNDSGEGRIGIGFVF